MVYTRQRRLLSFQRAELVANRSLNNSVDENTGSLQVSMLHQVWHYLLFRLSKPVRENLWRGLSNEARYEAKPIVGTLASRWGAGSAAFLMSLLDSIMDTGVGKELGTKSLFG